MLCSAILSYNSDKENSNSEIRCEFHRSAIITINLFMFHNCHHSADLVGNGKMECFSGSPFVAEEIDTIERWTIPELPGEPRFPPHTRTGQIVWQSVSHLLIHWVVWWVGEEKLWSSEVGDEVWSMYRWVCQFRSRSPNCAWHRTECLYWIWQSYLMLGYIYFRLREIYRSSIITINLFMFHNCHYSADLGWNGKMECYFG